MEYNNADNQMLHLHEMALTVVDHIDAMVAYWDHNQVCRFVNNAYNFWFGKTRDEILGTTMKELLGPLYIKNLPYIQGALEGQPQVFEREIPLPTGGTRHSLATYTPNVDNGFVRGFFVHVADVTSMKKLEISLKIEKEKAEILATHDFLTGLPNRVLLMDRISTAISHAKTENGILAVISMDMDHFKSVNDTYGHHEGDLLLIEISKRLKKATRESDSISRIGGDEFIILVQGVQGVEDIECIVHKILDTVNKGYKCHNKIRISPAFSVGIAVYPIDGTTPQELLVSSDNAMYEAKRQGRNRYHFNIAPSHK
jgi:diguanylate cyclase (GGDEF)-like protein/PAS domain S-box-containing protein